MREEVLAQIAGTSPDLSSSRLEIGDRLEAPMRSSDDDLPVIIAVTIGAALALPLGALLLS